MTLNGPKQKSNASGTMRRDLKPHLARGLIDHSPGGAPLRDESHSDDQHPREACVAIVLILY